MRLILREILPSSGQVSVGLFDLAKMKKRKIPYLRRNIGVVFQDFRLLPSKTVYDNVAFAMQIVGSSGKQIKKRVPEVLDVLHISSKAKKKPHELSGGEQQRVSIARAIVNEPKIIIADEPTGNLDFDTGSEIMEVLSDINRSGTTMLIVTHAREFVESMKRRVLTIENGELIRDEKGEQILDEA
jgi:cell division transport system ATP-binding protein